MKSRFQHIIEGSTYQGLEVFGLEDKTFYSLLKVKKKKGELDTVYEKVFESIEGLAPHVEKKKALFLVINSSKVLKKQVSVDSKLNLEQSVVQAFPNLDLENFYYEVLDAKEFGIVSIGKKEYVNQTLTELKSFGIVPARISLGISDLQNSIPYLKGSNIQGSNFRLISINSQDFKFESKSSAEQNNIKISGLSLSSAGLLSFSSILGYLGGPHKNSNVIELNQKYKNSFQNSRFFDFGIKRGLGFILGVLLINFLAFSYYHAKVQSMETVSESERQLSMLKTIKDRVGSKEERLHKLLGSSSSKSTFYMDRIAAGLPNSIQLDQMVYQPLLKPVREGKLIELDQNNIRISGYSKDKIQFAQWTEALEQEDWTGKVEILSFEYASNNTDKFIVKIKTNETGQ